VTEPVKSVLVVEDDVGIRECVVDLLTEGLTPVAARNGVEALHLARAFILLDLMLPMLSGWQFREAQLADSSISSIPVIVMSAVDSKGISADGLVHKVQLRRPDADDFPRRTMTGRRTHPQRKSLGECGRSS
jgi:CheY-like chemotaxis protein